MSTPFFKDKPIILDHVKSWPDSPDRTIQSAGRDSYADQAVQKALRSDPKTSFKLSDCDTLLNKYEPFKIGECTLYEKDPILALTQFSSSKSCYISDDSFPPDKWVNQYNGVLRHSRLKEKLKGDNPVMYLNGPNITDANQSNLGDCGFVSTTGAISLHPQGHNLLFSSIYPPVYNPMGVYSMRIIDQEQGKTGYLIVDDDLPDENYSYMTDNGEFWFFLIEKAFAKLGGGYSNLGGGSEKYYGLASTSNISITEEKKEEVWRNNFIPFFQGEQLTTYQGTGNTTQYLIPNHAYAVIDAAEWKDIRLVRLHNPWNTVKYNGDFCPGSQKWNDVPQEIQDKAFQNNRFYIQWEEKNIPTTFWMPYDYYRQDIPKISKIYLGNDLPDVLKKIANPNPIQERGDNGWEVQPRSH
ncbi:hypothetical protein DFQ28_001776 [Apophysomyces sp. BC1034]|nr:hypothetical protein DFQ30_000812 [Apophysomyces sp. BC1015]KAG0183103.1 hypothetical protein DFQ28_001776 [Apophysomyces sp. BC1034]